MEDHIKELATEIAAQCWCEEETKDMEMNVVLGEVFARKLSHWIDIAAQDERNTEYYRNLLVQCGEIIGEESYISDDGSVQNDVLCAKIPELVKQQKDKLYSLRKIIKYNSTT